MESEVLIGWDAERIELRAEVSRLEVELAESRAETEELRSRTNVLTERLSKTLDTSVFIHWETEQREWRKKLTDGHERETRQALLISKLQQKVREYKICCEHLQQQLLVEESDMRVKERILLDERSDNLETTFIRLEEEHQRIITLVEVNSLLRNQLSQSAEANQVLQEDLKKLTSDWSKAVEETRHKEMDWNKDKEVLSGYLAAEQSRLVLLWSRVVALRQQCHAVKTATDRDLWQMRAEFTRLSSNFLSLIVPAHSTCSPAPPSLLSSSSELTLDQLDHQVTTEELNNRNGVLSSILKSQELQREKMEVTEGQNEEVAKEREMQKKKYIEMERYMESVKQAVIKLYRVLSSLMPDGRTRGFHDPGVFRDDLHSLLSIIAHAESAVQWRHQELQEAERNRYRLRTEAESLQQQITELENERTELQKQAVQGALKLKQTQSLLKCEQETTFNLKQRLHEVEQHSEDLKKENARLARQRESEDEERMLTEVVQSTQMCERETLNHLELQRLQEALEQERLERERVEKEAAETRDALVKAHALALSLSSAHTLLQREAADAQTSLEKMAAFNESSVQEERELSALNFQTSYPQLEEECAETEVQQQRFRSYVASLQRELNAIAEENAELRSYRDADLDSILQLRTRQREIELELQIVREESKRMNTTLTKEKRKSERLNEEHSSVFEELFTVKAVLEEFMEQEKREERDRNELHRKKQQLGERLHTVMEEMEDIKQDREDLRNANVKLQQELCEAKEQISVLEVQNTQLQMQVHAIQHAKVILHGEIKCLQSESERLAHLSVEEKRGLTEERTKNKNEIKNCQLEITRLKAEAGQLVEKHKIQEKEREELQRESEALQVKLDVKDGEMDALTKRMEGLKTENKELTALIIERNGDMERLSSKIRSLEFQIKEEKDDMERWKEKVKDIQKENNGVLERVEQNQRVVKETSNIADLLRERDEVIVKNKKHIEDLIATVKLQEMLLEQLKQEKDIEIAAKLKEVEERQKVRDSEMREKERGLKEELKLKEIEKKGLKEKIEELMKDKKHVSCLLNERDTNLEKLQNNITNLEWMKKEVEDEVEQWKRRTEDRESEKKALLERLDNLSLVEQERDAFKYALRERDEEIKKLKEKDQEAVIEQERRSKLEDRDQILKGEIAELEVKLSEPVEENTEIQRKVLAQEVKPPYQTISIKETMIDVNGLKNTLEHKHGEENEGVIKFKKRLKDTNVKDQLKTSFQVKERETDQLEVELTKRRGKEGMLCSKLEKLIQDLQEELKRKEGEISAFKERSDLILKKREEEFKEVKEKKELMSMEVAKLREEIMVFSLTKEKERNEENRIVKEALKAGLEEMVTLKELLEESHREGEKLRKILEEKKDEITKGSKEELKLTQEEAKGLHIQVRLLQKKIQELQAQLWISENHKIKKSHEGEEKELRHLNIQQRLKQLEKDLKEKNDEMKIWEKLLKEEKKSRQCELEEKDIKLQLINEELKEKESDIKIMKKKIENNENWFQCVSEELRHKGREMDEKKKITEKDRSFKAVQEELGEKETESLKEQILMKIKFATENLHNQETELEKKVKNWCVDESEKELTEQERVRTLQKAVAQLELLIKKLEQRNAQLEQRTKRLRVEQRNLKDTLKQDCHVLAGADEVNLRAQAIDLTKQVHHLHLLLAADHKELSEFIDCSMRNCILLQTLRQDLNDSLVLVAKRLVPPVLESETHRLDRSIKEEQLRCSLSKT